MSNGICLKINIFYLYSLIFSAKIAMYYICQQYPEYFGFAKWVGRLAQDVTDDMPETPKDQ
ncbi:TPA: hypothetical protein ACIBOF_004405 [Salmonella enterica subsp. diarizonae serovar 61:r:-]